MWLEPFDFHPLTRVIYGPGRLDDLGTVARELGARRVLVVTDPGIVRAGHAPRAVESLRRAGIETVLFDGVEENPTTRHVRAGTEVARSAEVDLIVGVGGGSAMDCAKGINFILCCGGEMKDYQGIGKATGPLLPLIAVPTTAGTGSETQSFALIADEHTHRKMACGDKRAACRAAILDPEVTLSQPAKVTAATSIDAISHAVESFVTKRRNPLSRAFSLAAWRLLESSFERVLEKPDDLEARGAMQLGAAFAGAAIEHSMLGAAHSAANPLTARFGVVHGGAVGVMLPHVVRFNAQVVGDDYARLASESKGASEPTAEGLARRLEELLRASGLPTRLSEWGVPADAITELAPEAAEQWTANFNPRPITSADFVVLYREAGPAG
ncbi:MAG TPA: iron-containing alcohol dehydrogenase [Planctomycetota bacterium]|nr:iron-containing alcohol dehydrogenase [Planctomycetota bacterium]